MIQILKTQFYLSKLKHLQLYLQIIKATIYKLTNMDGMLKRLETDPGYREYISHLSQIVSPGFFIVHNVKFLNIKTGSLSSY